jgi:hypothetical protein
VADVSEESIRAAVSTAKPYTLLLLYKGPNYDTTGHLHMDHLRHVFTLRAAGEQLITMPVPQEGDLRGIAVFAEADRERVVEMASADPGVAAGRFRIEVLSCMGMPGDRLE